MRIINLASSSDGNSTYIESDDNKKILLDDGLSCAETVKRLQLIGINPCEIDALVISHEHSDHIKGVDVLSSKYNIPVYAHESVWQSLDIKLKKVSLKNRRLFDGTFNLNDLVISPFEVPHDVSCFGFCFDSNNKKIGFLTDLGHLNDKILQNIKGSSIVYLEANYDNQLLKQCTKYPLSLKQRIAGPNGHLSNDVSSEAVEFLALTGSKQIILAHLSPENNTPSLAYSSICKNIENQGIIEGKDICIDVATPSIGAFFRLK